VFSLSEHVPGDRSRDLTLPHPTTL
jgi:hypothetical protein